MGAGRRVARRGAALAAGLYTAAFVALLPRPAAPFIKQLMLAWAPGPCLVVDSGSNAVFGLDPTALGRALSRLGSTVADNGNINPIHKAFRLERLARPGDPVVLPFEWLHHDRPGRLTGEYLEAATGSVLSGYFRAPPWDERARFIAALPLGTALGIMRRNATAPLDARRAGADPARGVPDLHLPLTAG